MEKQYLSFETLLQRWDLKSRQAIYHRINREPNFPKPVKFGPGMVRFDLDDIQAYEATKIAELQSQ